ncbi:hypothetical protein [Flagellimonas sp.]|uniref:hypothetical protein n=1 Tax=Flagellimonas sp. TaxID=2058762 RepID=UPI003B525816
MKRATAILIIICLLTGCGGVKSLGDGAYLAKYDAEKRGALIYKDRSGKVFTVSEVQPDVAISSILQLSSNLSQGETFTAEQTVNITRTVAQLGERTEAVNILRDALHRLSEIRNNSGTIDKETKEIFENILSTVKEIISTDRIKAETELTQSKLELQRLLTN